MTERTREDLRQLSLEIQVYWGSHLYVKVVPSGTPCMDWREVLIPEEFASWSREELTQTMLHEWGHRMISPVSPARGAIWRKVARKQGLGKAQAQMLINIAADAWVDRYYLENRDWGEVYRQGMADSVKELEDRFSKEGKPEEPGKGRRLSRVYAAFYRRMVELVGRSEAAGEGASSFDLCPEEAACANSMWEILMEGAESPAERVRRLAVLLKGWLPEEIVVLIRGRGSITGRERDATGLTDELWREGQGAGLTRAELEEIFGRKQVEDLFLRRERLRMYATVVPVVKRFLSLRSQMAFTGYRPWTMGMPLKDLDLLATIQRSAILLPNVNTLARRFERRGVQSGKGAGGVVLIIDDSGSTEGDVLLREKEASFAVIAAARSFGDAVGCVVFGSEVTKSIPMTTQYVSLEEEICVLSSDSGGTQMAPAVREASRLAQGLDAFAFMLMTDSDIFDEEEVVALIRGLPSGAKVVAFCFNASDDVRENFGRLVSQRFRLLAAAPDRPFAEAALEEIYG